MPSIIDHFSSFPDPRIKEHKKMHKPMDIVFKRQLSVGAGNWDDMEEYGGGESFSRPYLPSSAVAIPKSPLRNMPV